MSQTAQAHKTLDYDVRRDLRHARRPRHFCTRLFDAIAIDQRAAGDHARGLQLVASRSRVAVRDRPKSRASAATGRRARKDLLGVLTLDRSSGDPIAWDVHGGR